MSLSSYSLTVESITVEYVAKIIWVVLGSSTSNFGTRTKPLQQISQALFSDTDIARNSRMYTPNPQFIVRFQRLYKVWRYIHALINPSTVLLVCFASANARAASSDT